MLSIPYLALRSWYSFLRGAVSPERLARWAADRGLPAAGQADRGNFYGLIRFVKAGGALGLRTLETMEFPGADEDRPGLLVLALDQEGYAWINRWAGFLLDHPGADAAGAVLDALEEDRRGLEGVALLVPPERAGHPALRQVSAASPGPEVLVAARYPWPLEEAREAARRTGFPLVAVAGGSWIDDEDLFRLRLLRAVELRRPIHDSLVANHDFGPWRIPEPAALEAFYRAVPEAVERARRMAERPRTRIMAPRFVFPSFEDLDDEAAFARLEALCAEALPRRFPGREAAARRRLDHELGIIRAKGFTAYFLVVHGIVRQAPRTCGRGSAASSIVSYLLGITHVDPLRYNLFFERFLNEARQDPPDIDVDFPWDERDRVLAWVFGHYAGRSAMVADHVTFASRAALREGVLALGGGEEELARWQKAWTLGNYDDIPATVWAAYKALKGCPRNLGTHPGGVVIVPDDLDRYVHRQTSPGGWPVIAWEKDAAEDAGLVKIDLLGNRSLAVLRDTLRACGEDETARWNDMGVLDDPVSRKMIEVGDTLGVFYVESPATRQLLGKMGRVDYEGLVAASSIIRPAANRYAKDWVRRLRGEAWIPVHPRVSAILAETFGIMVYQEDVSRVAMACAGFGPGEADALRKVLGKKDRAHRLPDWEARFHEGCRAEGLSPAQSRSLWDQILSFDGYSFCKSHSASYALVSWQLAWLKARHPLEFFTAVINNGGGFYATQVYVNQVRRMGFRIHLPSVQRSGAGWTIYRGEVWVGLGQVKGLSEDLVGRILRERARRPFSSARDVVARCAPDSGELVRLVRCGALDEFAGPAGRPGIFWQLLAPAGPGRGQGELIEVPVPAVVRDHPPSVRWRDEIETLDLWVSDHPLTLLKKRIYRAMADPAISPPGVRWCTAATLGAQAGKEVRIAGSLVASKEVLAKGQKTMGFVSFDDPGGIFETVLFPLAWQRLMATLMEGREFVIAGRVSGEWGVLTVEVHNLFLLNRRKMT